MDDLTFYYNQAWRLIIVGIRPFNALFDYQFDYMSVRVPSEAKVEKEGITTKIIGPGTGQIILENRP